MTPEERRSIILAFVDTCYDMKCITDSLIRYTADFSDNTIHLQIVVRSTISEDELDGLNYIPTYISAQFHDAQLDEEYIKISHASEMENIAPLPIRLYHTGMPI
ncbi:MAG: hypothetical protein QM645_09730 [Asticcacaulis sp.]